MQEKLTHKSLFTSIMTNPNQIEDPDICTTFAHGRDTSRDKTCHSPRLCLCVPQRLRAVSRQVQRNSEVCWISINFSRALGPLSLKILLHEITLETYDRPGSKKYFAKLFIGFCSWICELYGPKILTTCSNLASWILSDFGLSNGNA